jgi:hypothetical protein
LFWHHDKKKGNAGVQNNVEDRYGCIQYFSLFITMLNDVGIQAPIQQCDGPEKDKDGGYPEMNVKMNRQSIIVEQQTQE